MLIFEIDVFESDIDHVHFLIDFITRLSIASIVRKLKQVSTNAIWKMHGDILRKHFWRKKIFWSDGYFVCSIGEASPETVKKYIQNQG